MSEQQHYALVTRLTRVILKQVHSHPILREFEFDNIENVEQFHESAAQGVAENFEWSFGGIHNSQFTSVDDVVLFSKAVDGLLGKKGIGEHHRAPLLYMASLYDLGTDKQSQHNDKHNDLHDYARFLLDLVHNCNLYFDKVDRNEAYVKLYYQVDSTVRHLTDEEKYPNGKSYYFLKREVCEHYKYNRDELEEYYPDADHKDDLIWFNKVQFYNTKLHVPPHITLAITGTQQLKSFKGDNLAQLALPRHFQTNPLTYIIKHMLDYHKLNNTPFYRAFSKPNASLHDMKREYEKYQKVFISTTFNLIRVGKLVEDYLLRHRIFKHRTETADFLFEYFALLKVLPIPVRKNIRGKVIPTPLPPNDYTHLLDYYRRLGVTKEKVRLMMKDANRILGDI